MIEFAVPSNTVSTSATGGLTGGAATTPPAAVPAGTASAPKPAASASVAKPAEDKVPSKDPSGKSSTVATFPVSLGKVAIGSTLELRALTGLRTQSQQLERSNRNLNLVVTAIETEGGGDFLLKLSSFIEENQKTIVDSTQPFVLQMLGTAPKK